MPSWDPDLVNKLISISISIKQSFFKFHFSLTVYLKKVAHSRFEQHYTEKNLNYTFLCVPWVKPMFCRDAYHFINFFFKYFL
jgi:hypothetical protein